MLINFMWATQVPVIKLIGDRFGPVAIAFVPMILSTVLFLPALHLESRRRGRPLQWHWRDAKHFVIAGLFGMFLLQFTYTLGAQRTLGSNAAVITLSIPALVAVAASIMLGEKLTSVRVIGFILALAGVVMTSLPDLRGSHFGNGTYLLGDFLFLIACAASAFYNTYCKLLIDRNYTELEILVYTSAVASIASIPLFIWIEPLPLHSILARAAGCTAGDSRAGADCVWGIHAAFLLDSETPGRDAGDAEQLRAALLHGGAGGACSSRKPRATGDRGRSDCVSQYACRHCL